MLCAMASTGRLKKVGLQRIDAAYDALVPFGFSKEQIRNTIKNLLKVYGGDAGWVFVEEACYKLVIDTLLEQQEDGETENMETDERVPDAVGETNLLPAITSNNQSLDKLALTDQHGEDESEDIQSANNVISNRDDPHENSRVMPRRSVENIGSSYTQPRRSAENVGSSYTRPRRSVENIGSSYTQPRRSVENIGSSYTRPRRSVENVGSSYTRPRRSAENIGSSYTQPRRSAENIGSSYTRQCNKEPARAVIIESSHTKQRNKEPASVVTIGSSHTRQLNNEPASAVTIGSSSNQQPNGEPARKRPPCYGCFSETESDSDED